MSDFVRSVTVLITNASGADLTVNYGSLTGGAWETTPTPGTIILATKQQSYVNGVPNTFSALGGQLLLTPAGGGSISPIWNFPSSGPVSGNVNNTASELAVTYQLINSQTENPTMQVFITNAPAAVTANLLAAAK
jgi:hypothetical protein